jgi:phenylalanine ammonia-lyase
MAAADQTATFLDDLGLVSTLDTEVQPATLTLGDRPLRIDDVARVARYGKTVRLSSDPEVHRRIAASAAYIDHAVRAGEQIYGVTTGFGGMANTAIARDEVVDLQHNLLCFLKTGAGHRLPKQDVRAAMLLRANSHLRGVSGVRVELIERIVKFLNADVTPHVREFGSIGASGDLVPLSSIAGAVVGQSREFLVDMGSEQLDAPTALARLGLKPLRLLPKEGLAMVNGTSVMTGIAANCIHEARAELGVSLGAHALLMQALGASAESLHPFVHAQKPHPGQVWTAQHMRELLTGSKLMTAARPVAGGRTLAQDRYSLRCLPQYFGPIVEGIARITREVEVELNSATDNPLIDGDAEESYQCGNFLGEHIGVAMDQLRSYLGLLAKHLDVQIALAVTPEFSGGLPPSLVGNPARKVNMGLKGLQITGNSLMPLMTFYGNSFVDRFPTHAEQFNQNINSLGFGAARLARASVDTYYQYLAVALMFAVQAVDLRTFALYGHYDARVVLSAPTAAMYEAVREVLRRPPSAHRPYVRDDNDQSLDLHIARIAEDLMTGDRIASVTSCDLESLS